MKDYAFVSMGVVNGLFAPEEEQHRQIIGEYAAKGYRYVGYFPTLVNGHGVTSRLDLIFERDI